VYIDELVIEDTTTWNNNPPKQYYLMIGNQEYFRDSLEPLEHIMYDYAKREGFIEWEGQLRISVENERDRALFFKTLQNTDLDYTVEGPIVTIQTDVPEATFETLQEIMDGTLTRLQ
jgi:hypothetical protein